jgi:hypothetical protein
VVALKPRLSRSFLLVGTTNEGRPEQGRLKRAKAKSTFEARANYIKATRKGRELDLGKPLVLGLRPRILACRLRRSSANFQQQRRLCQIQGSVGCRGPLQHLLALWRQASVAERPVALPPVQGKEPQMSSLFFTCPTTHQQAPTGIETDVQSLRAAWRATLNVKCPHCGEVHEISVRETYTNGALKRPISLGHL